MVGESALLSGPNKEFCSVVIEQPRKHSMRKECGISFAEKNLTEFYKGLTPTDPELHSQIQKKVINLESHDGSKIYGGFCLL